METKLILLDLDYTLLKNDKTISQKSIKVLNACQKQGIKVGFSTSRGNTNIQQYVDLVNPDIIICNGGANIYSNGKLLHSQGFTLEQTRQIFAAAYKEKTLVWNKNSKQFKSHHAGLSKNELSIPLIWYESKPKRIGLIIYYALIALFVTFLFIAII